MTSGTWTVPPNAFHQSPSGLRRKGSITEPFHSHTKILVPKKLKGDTLRREPRSSKVMEQHKAHLNPKQWWWLPLLLQNQQTMTNQISVSFWFQAVLHMTAYCTSHKKKQEFPSGCPRKALSWSCCREDSCRNCFSITRTQCAEQHVWLQNPVKRQDAGIASHSGHEARTTSSLSGVTRCFFPLLPTTDHEDGWHPTGAWRGLFIICHEYHA